jgi:hypothetical protein
VRAWQFSSIGPVTVWRPGLAQRGILQQNVQLAVTAAG